MGFERVTAIIQGSKKSDRFFPARSRTTRPIFSVRSSTSWKKLSGKKYASTLRSTAALAKPINEKIDIAFASSGSYPCAIASRSRDGSSRRRRSAATSLRRILRPRAFVTGRALGFHEPFFFKLVDVRGPKLWATSFPKSARSRSKRRNHSSRRRKRLTKTLDKGNRTFRARSCVRGIARTDLR